jgi:hypothetical protein
VWGKGLKLDIKSTLLGMILLFSSFLVANSEELFLVGRVPASLKVRVETGQSRQFSDRENTFFANLQKSGNLSADSDINLVDSSGIEVGESGLDTNINKLSKKRKAYKGLNAEDPYILQIVAH